MNRQVSPAAAEMDKIIDSALAGCAVKERSDRLHELEHRLASEGAMIHITRYGTFLGVTRGHAWFKPPARWRCAADRDKYVRAISYLDLRGCVVRSPGSSYWIGVNWPRDHSSH